MSGQPTRSPNENETSCLWLAVESLLYFIGIPAGLLLMFRFDISPLHTLIVMPTLVVLFWGVGYGYRRLTRKPTANDGPQVSRDNSESVEK
jgi:hypothetical protein